MAQNSIEQITETIHTPKIFSQYDKKKNTKQTKQTSP